MLLYQMVMMLLLLLLLLQAKEGLCGSLKLSGLRMVQ